MRARAWLAAGSAALLGACSGVQHTVHADVPMPHTIAVLPFAGGADLPLRDSARTDVQSRLRDRGLLPIETAWVDRVLSEHGWLGDPAAFDPEHLPWPEVVAALGVDAVVIGRDFDESRFNLLLVRRHAFGGSLSMQRADGAVWWSATHKASNLGGLLLASGQLITEIQAQSAHGTPMATIALIDEFADDVIATVPAQAPVAPGAVGMIAHSARIEPATDRGGERLVVQAQADPGATVSFDAPPWLGVPMAALPGHPDTFRGAHDLAPGTAITTVTVVARDANGRTSRVEVKP